MVTELPWWFYCYFAITCMTLLHTMNFFMKERINNEFYWLNCIVYSILWPIYWTAVLYGKYVGRKEAIEMLRKHERDRNGHI